MAYLLSLLPADSSERDPLQILCYYQNHTPRLQMIRASDQLDVCFKKLIYPDEGVLFLISQQAYLDVHSTILGVSRIFRIDCKELCLR